MGAKIGNVHGAAALACGVRETEVMLHPGFWLRVEDWARGEPDRRDRDREMVCGQI